MRARYALLVAFVVSSGACVKTVDKHVFEPDVTLAASGELHASTLKAHMRDGSLFVFDEWRADEAARRVDGSGIRYDLDRNVVTTGSLGLTIDSVALFETNDLHTSPSIVPMTILTVGSIGATVYCIANPKACFGSCPTFYDPSDSDQILAEGFSASIAPSLEATDLDALPSVRPSGDLVRLFMRNEALETHVVRWADLVAVPRPPERRVYALFDGGFVEAGPARAPEMCVAPEGDCLPMIAEADARERLSLADSLDVATREQVEIVFRPPPVADGERLGLVIVSRQSLLPTYILYQALAFMGTRATEWLAALERQSPETQGRTLALVGRLGSIRVEQYEPAGGWTDLGEVLETGPLARDTRVIPLAPTEAGPVRLRLALTKGMWRIDQLALVSYRPARAAVRIRPTAVRRGGVPDEEALSRLVDGEAQLSTVPGDEYELIYRLPDPGASYELFLESRGYYLEWMRDEWIREENPLRAAQLFLDPAAAFREMAPEFKRAEPDMERIFWSSRYAREP